MSKIYNPSGGYRKLHSFIESGGMREKMTAARLEARADPAAPPCPDCGAPMTKRNSQRGPFWGCSAYHQCQGTRQVDAGGPMTP